VERIRLLNKVFGKLFISYRVKIVVSVALQSFVVMILVQLSDVRYTSTGKGPVSKNG